MNKILFLLGIMFVMVGINSSDAKQASSDDMNYLQFLDFCSNPDPKSWEMMSINERQLNTLCDFQAEGFGQKQWHWLNGANFDWKNFAQIASNEYASTIPEFKDGIKETLRVDSFVSNRASFPPPMSAAISFDYTKYSQIRQYDEKFTICMDGKLISQNGFIGCSDEYVKYDYTEKEPFTVPKAVKKILIPEDTRQQMLDWCQNSPKYAKSSNQFWDVIPVRLVSDTDEFQLLRGIKESFVINSNFVELSCPPNAWMSGTFASESGKRHRFALEYDMNNFGYQIDKTELADDQSIPTPRQQMKMGVPLYEIKCNDGFYPTFKIDRVTPACVTEVTLDKLLIRGWSPLRLGMPAETNILVTYGAIQVFPYNVTQKLDLNSPHYNTIFWVNNDIISHTIVAKDGTWSTGVIESGKIGSMIFNQTGVYEYFVKEKPSTTGFVEFSGIIKIED